MKQTIIFFPYPKKLVFASGFHLLRSRSAIFVTAEAKLELLSIAERLQKIIDNVIKTKIQIIAVNQNATLQGVHFCKKDAMHKESYILDISENLINICYSDPAGAFHAVSTLKQIIIQCGKMLPCLKIEDCPDFEARGIMLDISRSRIPTLDTLFGIVDLMADLKLNQLQLYIEGFSFAYPSFSEVWRDQTPVTGEEIMLLDKYCKEKYIDLVPNQNSFGHMAPWLSKKDYNDLAECQKGCRLEEYGWDFPPFTLNPLDSRCISFVEKMYDDLLPNFTSEYFNVGLDETLDLGRGKSRELCEKVGKARVYLDFLIKIYRLVKERGKKMMFWGDIIVQHPELIPELPKDIISMLWGYNSDQPYECDCKKFMQSGIPYYVCPGTSSWNSITGLTENMKSNVLNAAVLGKKYKATGYLNTDWGTTGHWQHLPVSYAGFCYGAALSWGVEENRNVNLAEYLDRFVFNDVSGRMGQLVLDIGNYNLKEKKTNYDGTGIFRTLQYSQLFNRNTDLDFLKLSEIDKSDFESVREYVLKLYEDMEKIEMQCRDAVLIEAEYRNAIRLILHAVELGLFKLENQTGDGKGKREKLLYLIEEINEIILEYKEVWMKRNRLGGLDESIKKLEELKRQYIEAYGDHYESDG